MKSKYLIDPETFELPTIDSIITEFVKHRPVYYGDEVFPLAIEHNGVCYRVVICEESEDLFDFNDLMLKHGYKDLAWEQGAYKGYSSYFVHKSALS